MENTNKWGDKGVFVAPRRKFIRYYMPKSYWEDELDVVRRQLGDEKLQELFAEFSPKIGIVQRHFFGKKFPHPNIIVVGGTGGQLDRNNNQFTKNV